MTTSSITTWNNIDDSEKKEFAESFYDKDIDYRNDFIEACSIREYLDFKMYQIKVLVDEKHNGDTQ